jgi:L-ascorbate metabolism protein UlaG (beta-lactamase superfamily)
VAITESQTIPTNQLLSGRTLRPEHNWQLAGRSGATSPEELTPKLKDERMMMARLGYCTLTVCMLFLPLYFPVDTHAQETKTSAELEKYRGYFLEQTDAVRKNGAVTVTYLGTTTLLFDDGETQLMIDGFFTRPSLKQFKGKIETNPKVVDDALKRAKVTRLKALFVTHTHEDHSLDSTYVVKNTGAMLYGSGSMLNIARGANLPERQMSLFWPGKELTFGAFKLTVLNSKHSPASAANDDIGHIITQPLAQPALGPAYVEGGSYDFLIKHGNGTIYVKPSANWIDGAMDNIHADVLFLSTATLGVQKPEFQKTYYAQTVKKVMPRLVIPVHWDNFLTPLSEPAALLGPPLDNGVAGFDFVIDKLKRDEIQFGIMLPFQSINLFGD